MSDNENKQMALDDVQRVKVLSPGRMVMSRFLRNRLSVAGIVIIILMFAFSFLGGIIMPYSQSDVFYTKEEMKKAYAGATFIESYQVMPAAGVTLPTDLDSKLILAMGKGETSFNTRDGASFELVPIVGAGAEGDANAFFLQKGGAEQAIISLRSFIAYDVAETLSYSFCRNALVAICTGEEGFTADGRSYTLEVRDENVATAKTQDGKEYAFISNINMNAVNSGTVLSTEFRMNAAEAMENGKTEFSATDADGNEVKYMIERKGAEYTISSFRVTQLIDTYSKPSKKHLMGTDANGMDLLARLMYGGRISLLIGFVVIAIELAIGIVVGGVAGFFGGWVDNLLMRLVDVIYCIPSIPLYLILGSIMDMYRVSPTTRIYMLCIIISIIGWVSIARIIRGQILSLREQEFMLAAEAAGLSVRRRIFKHLIPNVIPQLVVFATMGIGDVILTEAALSFLGLGIKYPAASWGSIINAVNDSYVLTNFPFVWIPAGTFILLTVLAFNFIGDGLRDAFDPKMKR